MISKIKKRFLSVILMMLVMATSLVFGGCDSISIDFVTGTETATEVQTSDSGDRLMLIEESSDKKQTVSSKKVYENKEYDSKNEVAQYIHLYGHLPSNYITKKDAESLGWNSSKGNLWDVADGKSIGGSYFGNYEGALPKKSGRKWYECDINYKGGYRGSERILYSNDGLVYYTSDHYKTFEKLY